MKTTVDFLNSYKNDIIFFYFMLKFIILKDLGNWLKNRIFKDWFFLTGLIFLFCFIFLFYGNLGPGFSENNELNNFQNGFGFLNIFFGSKSGGIAGDGFNSDLYSVYFCPQDNCSINLINQINRAVSTIDVAIYSFTHSEISRALISAKNRGVVVRVIFDSGQTNSEYSEYAKLDEYGFDVKKKSGDGYMHNKFMVIDSKIVITGSFNYSMNADTKNNENIIVLGDEFLASKYVFEFNRLWKECD
jgi:hypothetical protein